MLGSRLRKTLLGTSYSNLDKVNQARAVRAFTMLGRPTLTAIGANARTSPLSRLDERNRRLQSNDASALPSNRLGGPLMSWWIVSHIPSWVLLIGLIVLIAGGAALIQRYVRRRFPVLKGDEHNDGTKFTYGFIGFFYAFFIGFVVSSMWGQNNAADGNSRAEGAAAVQMARDAVVFEAPDRDRIRQSLLTYEQAAIAEWSQAENRRSPDADTALARLYKAYDGIAAKTGTQKTLLSTSFSNLDKISQARTVRLLTAREDAGLPWSLWAVIFLTSALVLGTVIIYGVEKPILHYPMVAIVAVIVATNLSLILQLAHPYVGEISTSSDPLQEVVAVLSQPVP
jgi:hypothetical protein